MKLFNGFTSKLKGFVWDLGRYSGIYRVSLTEFTEYLWLLPVYLWPLYICFHVSVVSFPGCRWELPWVQTVYGCSGMKLYCLIQAVCNWFYCCHVIAFWNLIGAANLLAAVQFSSVHFDLITQEMHAGFSCRSWAPLVGDGDDPHHWTRLSYHKWHCLNLFFWKGKGQIPFFKIPFFKAHHPSTEKPKALVGFEPRTEPELGTGDSHFTSTPLPPPSRSNSLNSQ